MYETTRRRLTHSASVFGRRNELLPELYAPGMSECSVETNSSNLAQSLHSAIAKSREGRSRAVSHSIYAEIDGPGPGKYARSSAFGEKNHDLTLVKNPAYSIGKASREFSIISSPNYFAAGPASYCPEKYFNSFSRPRSPVATIGRAPRLLNRPSRFGPSSYEAGPASYSPERSVSPHHKASPAYSMGKAKRFAECCVMPF